MSKLNNLNPSKIKEARLARGYTTTQLAKELGVSRQAVSKYEHGQSIPKGEVFSKIVDVLDFPISFFIEQNESYYSHKSTPVFFRSLSSATKQSRKMTKARFDWVKKLYLYLSKYLEFPKVNIPYDLPNESFIESDDIENCAHNLRKYWGLGMGPISNITLLLEKNGIVIAKNPVGDKIDACSEYEKDLQRPFVLLGSDNKTAVRCRLDLSHELGHILFHRDVDIEDLYDNEIHKKLEKEAFNFASAFLLPRETFGNEVVSSSLEHFIQLKKRWKVSIQAMIYRCEELGILSEHQVLYLRKKISKNKMRKIEPLDNEMKFEEPVLLKQAMTKMMEHNVKSSMEIKEDLKIPTSDIETLANLRPGTLESQKNANVIKLDFKGKSLD